MRMNIERQRYKSKMSDVMKYRRAVGEELKRKWNYRERKKNHRESEV